MHEGNPRGKALTEHPAIKAIAFLGESRTGSMIMRQGAETFKRLHFELGGKNPVIVFDDAKMDRLQPIHQQYNLYRGVKPLRIDHFNLFSANVDASVAFYGEMGFRVTEYTQDAETGRS